MHVQDTALVHLLQERARQRSAEQLEEQAHAHATSRLVTAFRAASDLSESDELKFLEAYASAWFELGRCINELVPELEIEARRDELEERFCALLLSKARAEPSLADYSAFVRELLTELGLVGGPPGVEAQVSRLRIANVLDRLRLAAQDHLDRRRRPLAAAHRRAVATTTGSASLMTSSGKPVPRGFQRDVMRAMPPDGTWIHGEPLLAAARNGVGGRYLEGLAAMARPDGPLESRKGRGDAKGYRLRYVPAEVVDKLHAEARRLQATPCS